MITYTIEFLENGATSDYTSFKELKSDLKSNKVKRNTIVITRNSDNKEYCYNRVTKSYMWVKSFNQMNKDYKMDEM